MKVSYNWLKKYIDISETPEELGRILTDAGLEVESITPFETIRGGLKGLVIGHVVTCEKHPGADRLHITTVEVGNENLLPIVCGAPNVASGQKVVVAKTGTTLYPLKGDPFIIKKTKIRGEISEGMICAEDEIGLGSSHGGILVLDTDLPPGTSAAEFFQIEKDHTFEIGLTPNRGDATSHIGVARDLKAILSRVVKWPSVENFSVDEITSEISVTVENTEACPRYSAVCISGVTIKESPRWLQQRLQSIGFTPINNVVDITNFVLNETGQPLHAFDAGKISGNTVIVKMLPGGARFTTLDEKERTLNPDDLMICNKDSGMCIAGVFGGIDSEVKDSTTNIFLESAYFSPDYIRKTAQYHGLKTDASFRFERGTDPNLTVYALKRAAILIKEIAGGKISSDIIDIYPEKIEDVEINATYKHIDRLIGKQIDREEIHAILERLDINTEDETEEGFTAIVPPYRVDVQREADLIEEILRIYGFNKVELPDTLGSSFLAEYPENDPNPWVNKINAMLVGKGWYEIMTNSLTRPEYVEWVDELDAAHNVEILNKLSEDLGVLKQTMLFTGLESLAHNINRKQTNLKLFEFGRVYKKTATGYADENRLALFLTGKTIAEDWRKIAREINYYDLAAIVHAIIDITTASRNKIDLQPFSGSMFEYGSVLTYNDSTLGHIGKINEAISKKFEIKQEIFYAELDWDLLLKSTCHNIVYAEVSKFPSVKRDLSLVIDKTVSFSEIEGVAKITEPHLIKDIRIFDVYEGERIEKGKKAYAITFILQDEERTLTDKIIDKTMSKLMKAYENETGAMIRQ